MAWVSSHTNSNISTNSSAARIVLHPRTANEIDALRSAWTMIQREVTETLAEASRGIESQLADQNPHLAKDLVADIEQLEHNIQSDTINTLPTPAALIGILVRLCAVLEKISKSICTESAKPMYLI